MAISGDRRLPRHRDRPHRRPHRQAPHDRAARRASDDPRSALVDTEAIDRVQCRCSASHSERCRWSAGSSRRASPSREHPSVDDCTISRITSARSSGQIGPSRRLSRRRATCISGSAMADSSARCRRGDRHGLGEQRRLGCRRAIMACDMATSDDVAHMRPDPIVRPQYLLLLSSSCVPTHPERLAHGARTRRSAGLDISTSRLPVVAATRRRATSDRAMLRTSG